MGKLHEWIGLTLSLLGLLIDPGFGYYIIEGPRNLTVLAGSDARFNCTVSDGWKIIIWLFDGSPKLSVLSTGQIIQTDQRYNQQSYRNGTRFTSELIMYDVQLNDSGQIKCSIQDADDNKYAFLSVQVKGSLDIKDRNFTVRMNRTINIVCEALGWAPAPHIFWMANNISLDNSVYVTSQHQGLNGLYNEESILTLTPMTNVTVTCLAALDALSKPQYATVNVTVYEPSPKSNYQKEMRKVSGKKTPDKNLETQSHIGEVNYGYNPEETKHAEKMTGDPAFFTVNTDTYASKDLKVRPPSQAAYYGHHDGVPPSGIPAYPVSPRKIRNVTHV
ncbi:immunoglobulin superfamily member 5-like isoform X3 [Varanus komodoensis]|uniref:Ig-like domain-containing protein n=1 Tax=Varanus komodoensis TaxID=61221 RepID=A0A8D2LKM4_VARKO|nr:immunoglobulin superfamily member 5-like isoform X3 [Varanus komodoensis]